MKNRVHTIYRQLATTNLSWNTKRTLACLLIALTLLALVVASRNIGQSGVNAQGTLPRGDWSLSAHPYLGADYESIPVIVTGVTSNARGGVAVKKVGLENQSGKDVRAVKLSWYLSTEQAPNVVVLQGQTPFITRDGEFPAGSHLTLRFPVVTFANIYKPLARNGTLNGEFRIDILASEILYADGSTWKRENTSQAKLVKAAYRTTRSTAQLQCPKQACESVNSPNNIVSYRCKASTAFEMCKLQDVQSCLNEACGRVSPSGEYEGYEMIQQ